MLSLGESKELRQLHLCPWGELLSIAHPNMFSLGEPKELRELNMVFSGELQELGEPG